MVVDIDATEGSSTVYCIVPTHNRLEKLEKCLRLIVHQEYPSIVIIVIDDGSSDGTREYLDRSKNDALKVIHGDGNMWWGGAVAAGMRLALSSADASDYVLLMNDDVSFEPDYVSNIVAASRLNNHCTMVSPQYDTEKKFPFYTGYRIDYYRQKIKQVADEPIHASVGRGLLVPVGIVKDVGTINSRRFRHYMGDIEYTARIKEAGHALSVAWSAPMYSDLTPSDTHVQMKGEWAQRLHKRSKTNLGVILMYFCTRGPLWTRITALPRMAIRIGRLALNRAVRSMLQN